MSELKLYVWENVLEDYTSGIAFAIAPSKDEALRLIAKTLGINPPKTIGFEEWLSDHPDFNDTNLTVHPLGKKVAYAIYGGG